MALLDSLFGQTPSYYGGLLGEDELSRLRQQAQEQGTLNTAMALLQAGAPSRTPGGGALAIAQGLQQGQKAYREALNQGLQEKMVGLQLGEQMRKMNESQRMREMFPHIFQVTQTPEQLTMYGKPTEGVIRDDEGNLMPGGGVTPAQRTINVDTNKLLALTSMSSNPLETLTAMSKLVPDLRKAGFTGGTQGMENPFSVYANDPSVPPALRQVAANYQQSYARGLIDQETADKRLGELGARVQSAQQFQQSQAALASNREFMQGIAGQNAATQATLADLRKQAEENKPEQFSYSQKKEFDAITAARDEAKKAEANASLAVRAAPLLTQAYGGPIEAGIKGVAGAIGIGSEAKDANDRLATLSQTLAVQAPKFGGPTSDADAKRYDKAVGDLANPKVALKAKQEALKDIDYLGKKARAYADQAENYFYQNKKSMRGFQFVPPPDPYAEQNAPF
jgi:hypothetical protein